ncbi:MAG: DUF3754 domain-containing protein [Planctomycetes bacterium]|nr:DUF3754 domain-containing protein [Planctomycetota bacterium]
MKESLAAPGGTTHAPEAVAAGEPYVPLGKHALIDALVRRGNLDDSTASQFRKLCRLTETILHQEFHQRQEHLKLLYAPFDPDTDSRPVKDSAGPSRGEMADEFLNELGNVLTAANYHPLTQKDLNQALSGATYWGLDLQIDRDIFDRLMIFVRGDNPALRVRRDLGTWFRRRQVELDVYERLVLAVKLREKPGVAEGIDTDSVYLKAFREIPRLDVEMLLPGTRPRIRWFDTAKIGGSSITGIYGLIRMGITHLVGFKVTWLMITLGAFSYAWQSFMGYRRTKANYVYSMTQQLYYQNLDNNAGVFCRVIDEAEEEETKEMILAYFFLWRHADGTWTPDRVGDEVEKLVREQTGECCRFQAREAIAKLERLGLLTADSDKLQAIEPAQALAQLSERWTNCVAEEFET